MEEIYYSIGLLVFWISAGIGSLMTFGFLGKIILNELGKRFKIFWVMLEFVHYKKQFKEWVKDQKRHPKAKQTMK